MSFYDTQARLWADWNYSTPIILHGFVRALKPDIFIETGCYRAFSTCWIAKALQENNKGKIVTIDNWSLTEHVDRYGDPRSHAVSNMEACGVREWIEILDGDPKTVQWPESCQMAYLDCWHSYDQVKFEFQKCAELGATFIALDDTENCVGPRMFAEEMAQNPEWESVHFHSDNGLTIFVRKEAKRLITFSQELPNNPGVDLRPLTLEQQAAHFKEALEVTGIDYSPILGKIEHV